MSSRPVFGEIECNWAWPRRQNPKAAAKIERDEREARVEALRDFYQIPLIREIPR